MSGSRPRPPVRGPLGGGPMSGLAMPVEKPQDFGPTVRRLGRRLEPERPWLISVLALASVSVALAVLGPKLLGDATTLIFDGVIGGSGVDVAALAQQAALVAIVYLFSSLFAWAQAYLVAGIVQRAMYALREDVETTLGRLPLRYFDSSERGDLLSRVTNDLDNISTTMQQIAAQLVNSVLTVVGVLVMMFWISPLLAVISLLTVPLSFVVTMAIARRSQPHFVTQWRTTGLLNSHVEETYTGHDLVKVFGMQERVVADFDEVNEQVFQSSFRAQFISGIIQPAMHFVGNLNYVLICVVGGVRVANGTMTIGDVQAFIQYSRQFTMPITQIASVVNLMQSGVASTERVFAVLDATPEKPDPIAPARVSPVRGRVTFEGVSFRYRPDLPLIDDLDLVVEPGETIAIVGPTGAGKTTLVNLLMRFYDIDAGRITLDGVDTATMTRDDVRRSFAMVLQDTWLFGGTIRDNIAYGGDAGDGGVAGEDAAGPDEQAIYAAARAAYVDHYVRTLPDGYDTVLDEDASNLSAGEKQLMTIARAFLADRPVLILDEATSSVDTRTEVLIQQAMAELRRGRTSFVIAHRLSTIRDADTILVMDDGSIVEQGSHEELIDRGGVYADLYASQFLSELTSEPVAEERAATS